MLSTMLQAESDVLKKRSTAAPWRIIVFQYSSFKTSSRSFPSSSNSPNLSHIVVAKTTFFALLEPVSSAKVRRLRCCVADIRKRMMLSTYTIPDSNICFLYLRRCGYRGLRGSNSTYVFISQSPINLRISASALFQSPNPGVSTRMMRDPYRSWSRIREASRFWVPVVRVALARCQGPRWPLSVSIIFMIEYYKLVETVRGFNLQG